MTEITPIPLHATRISVAHFLQLFERGALGEGDRVELLEGVIVAMAPPNPPHDAAVTRCTYALIRALGDRAVIRTQCSFVASAWSLPQPDIAAVPGGIGDYDARHPSEALLVVEVSDSSLKQDRLSKSRIYAAAGVPEYWIVNLREQVVEVMCDPDPATALYRETRTAVAGESLELTALPSSRVAVSDLLPQPR